MYVYPNCFCVFIMIGSGHSPEFRDRRVTPNVPPMPLNGFRYAALLPAAPLLSSCVRVAAFTAPWINLDGGGTDTNHETRKTTCMLVCVCVCMCCLLHTHLADARPCSRRRLCWVGVWWHSAPKACLIGPHPKSHPETPMYAAHTHTVCCCQAHLSCIGYVTPRCHGWYAVVLCCVVVTHACAQAGHFRKPTWSRLAEVRVEKMIDVRTPLLFRLVSQTICIARDVAANFFILFVCFPWLGSLMGVCYGWQVPVLNFLTQQPKYPIIGKHDSTDRTDSSCLF